MGNAGMGAFGGQQQPDVRQADEQRFQRLDGFGEEQPRGFEPNPDWGNQTSNDMRAAIEASMQQ